MCLPGQVPEVIVATARAEVVGFLAELPLEGFRAIDLHPAHRIRDAAAGCEPEHGREDQQAEHVERELVVHLDRAEDVAPARPRPARYEPDGAKDAGDD